MKNLAFHRRVRTCDLHFPVYCKIHGVKRTDRQGALAQCRAKDRLQIVHATVHGNDEVAYVYSVELNRILGYISDDLTKKLIYVFGKNFCLDATIENITGGPPNYQYFGCNIRILSTASMMNDIENFSHLFE